VQEEARKKGGTVILEPFKDPICLSKCNFFTIGVFFVVDTVLASWHQDLSANICFISIEQVVIKIQLFKVDLSICGSRRVKSWSPEARRRPNSSGERSRVAEQAVKSQVQQGEPFVIR